MTLFDFMSQSPVLSFFLALIIFLAIEQVSAHIAYAIRGPKSKSDEKDKS